MASPINRLQTFSFIFFSLLCLPRLDAFPTGAPVDACASMEPLGHGFSPDNRPSPYQTTPNRQEITSNSTLILTLSSQNGASFKGYLTMVFDSETPNGLPLGVFTADSEGQRIDCPGSSLQNAATHTSNDLKRSVTLYWTPPEDFVGTVLIKTTFLQDYYTFWVRVPGTSLVNIIA